MFRPNRRAVDELKKGAAYRRMQEQKAKAVVRTARAIAPDGSPRPGYRETLSVGEVDGDPVAQTSDAFWHLIEYGSTQNPAYAPLRRAVRAEGLDFRDDQ